MFKKISMLAAAAVLAMGTAASAATINFGTSGASGSTGVGAGTYSSSATYTVLLPLLTTSATVTSTAAGLGVRGNLLDGDPTLIDGKLVGTYETLRITFSWAVNLINFTLGGWDSNDDVEYSFDGIGYSTFGPGVGGSSATIAGQNNVTDLFIRARGTLGADGLLGNDEFVLASANVAAVPVPAAGLLLIGALGGLAALRRRKTA